MTPAMTATVTHRAAAIWRDPNFPPPEVAHWHTTPFAAPTREAAEEKARNWRDTYGPMNRTVAIVYLGSGIVVSR